ncbi:MerR family transcriptional regulator [Adhaeribacter terreus]|uniref:MerR family transcriptional regulator n=1 Tax=Adhaeribacter terreus TaxID=529703 RepID=A0ABW0E8L3_9BACT
MAHYSIKELEHLSGIKAHTIRIWEQRYAILTPKRTDTNIRFYNDADLKNILNVSLLNERGFKISKIAKMKPEQIAAEIMALSEMPGDNQSQVNALIAAMLDMNEEHFEKALNKPILQLGFEHAILQVVYPFLNKIGILWQTNNICPAHEHFVSNLIRQKLIVAIDGQNLASAATSEKFLLFLPEGELHELALLFMNYLLRARKYHVLYLSQNLPFPDLVRAFDYYQPQNIVTALTSFPERDQVQHFLDKLSRQFPQTRILVYGHQAQYDFLKFPENTKKLNLISDFIEIITPA